LQLSIVQSLSFVALQSVELDAGPLSGRRDLFVADGLLVAVPGRS